MTTRTYSCGLFNYLRFLNALLSRAIIAQPRKALYYRSNSVRPFVCHALHYVT